MKEENIKYVLFGGTLILISIALAGVCLTDYKIDTLKNNHIAHLENITEGAEWVCIAQVCVDYAVGDDWIVDNCRPEGENKTLMCKLIGTDKKEYKAPLSIINLSNANVRSCREYACAAEVYVRGRT